MSVANAIRLTEYDNVGIALCDLNKGDKVLGIVLLQDVKKGHKLALCDIKNGQNVIKYGSTIGSAKTDIKCGEHVHVHNVRTNLDEKKDYEFLKEPLKLNIAAKIKERRVNVFKRKSGEFGIRNELWVIPTVGCVNAQGKQIVEAFVEQNKNIEGIDDVVAFSHPYGCSQLGDDHERTKKILQRMAKHPNAGGVLVLGLGCENNQIDEFKKSMGDYDRQRVRFLIAQEVEDEVTEGVKILNELYKLAKHDKRVETDFSSIKVGLKCGGSDGLSGITANPLLGLFSDYVINYGGTSVLTEVPEMFGAEELLMKRAANSETFEKIVRLVNGFKEYFLKNGQVVYENPSPGNKEGGITTLEDKSLGCTQKGGTSEVVDVVLDGEEVKRKGLNLLNGPGNDIVAVTNLGAAGCQLVLFTTGRGTPLGGFVPTVKVSTNEELFNLKPKWMDFNSADVLKEGFEQVLERFIDKIVSIINGEKTKNELTKSKDIAIFKTGITL